MKDRDEGNEWDRDAGPVFLAIGNWNGNGWIDDGNGASGSRWF
jgi:hypothetical protein